MLEVTEKILASISAKKKNDKRRERNLLIT